MNFLNENEAEQYIKGFNKGIEWFRKNALICKECEKCKYRLVKD